MLPWFTNGPPPLYLAPMAGVTDLVFRTLCKELGADVMVTEFVSAEGVIRQDKRTRKYTEFTESHRPVGVQLFGADGARMGEAARKIIDWKRPDFIDLNFGCPVNKVVAKNGGSSLLRDCPLLADTAAKVVAACAPLGVPVTGKIRTGWDSTTINATEVCRILEDCGIQAVTVHGRTRAQGYSGLADWEVIAACAASVAVPVIGNGDIGSGEEAALRLQSSGVQGVMIGRAAMQSPWIFAETKHYLTHGELPPAPTFEDRWGLILRHCRMAIDWGRYGNERQTIQAMRSRLMAYSKGLPSGKLLRTRFSKVASLTEIEELAREHLRHTSRGDREPPAGESRSDAVSPERMANMC